MSGIRGTAFQNGTSLEHLDGGWRSATSHSISPRDPDGHEIELYVELSP